ncbi:hypothetical protein [Rufibacter ruber]|uniref:hypothetical protein n=1 Tax=Rufibacter ruber TaxID=1783499 RepID=UPI00082E7C5D|nr:hypothetical protein [Rufibacter ruber]
MIIQSEDACFYATQGLQQLATIINKERNVLVEYAAKPSLNKIHLERRNIFLQSLANTYNTLYKELQAASKLRMMDTWVLLEQELNLLLMDTNLNGVYIMLRVSDGNNYGFIKL